jgi:hypothetical protein
MKRKLLRSCLAALVMVAACGSDQATPDAPAPTYTELYMKYFAVGTPGHCANTGGCHSDALASGWACGADKNTCYNGMATIPGLALIDPSNPKASLIADPANSPLRWVSPNGFMPADALMPFPEGRDAIKAWVAAGAQNT